MMRSKRPWVMLLIGVLLAAAAVSQSVDRPGVPADGTESR